MPVVGTQCGQRPRRLPGRSRLVRSTAADPFPVSANVSEPDPLHLVLLSQVEQIRWRWDAKVGRDDSLTHARIDVQLGSADVAGNCHTSIYGWRRDSTSSSRGVPDGEGNGAPAERRFEIPPRDTAARRSMTSASDDGPGSRLAVCAGGGWLCSGGSAAA
jgi:hypothetical protein